MNLKLTWILLMRNVKKMSTEVQNIVVRKAKTGEGNGRGAVCRQGGISSAMGKNIAGLFELNVLI